MTGTGFDGAAPAAPTGGHRTAAGCVAAVLVGPTDGRPGDRRRPPGQRPGDRRPPRRWDRGSTTAELAVGLPALVMLLALGVLMVTAVGAQIQCVSAARDGALGAARGDGGEDAARRAAPHGASVIVAVDGERAQAVVSAQVRPFGGLLPAVTVKATSVAAVEPGGP